VGVFALIKKENIRVTITIPRELHKLIKDDAEYEDRSVSNYILRILKDRYKIKNED
jgi:uncharacterized protein (DUF1778 family)